MNREWAAYWIRDPFWGGIDKLTYLGLRCLPVRGVSAAGAFIGGLARHRFRTAQADVLANLKFLYPDLTAAEKNELAATLWKNIGRTLTEMAVLDRFNHADIPFRDECGIIERLDRTSPVVFLYPHLGNWELLALAISRLGFHLHVVYERLPNRFQRKLVADSRKRLGYDLISPDFRGSRQMFRALAAGQSIGIAMDEFKHGKIIAPTFNGPLPADANIRHAINLARRFNAPLVTGYCLRKEETDFEIICASILDPFDPSCAEKINEQCRHWIMEHPEQWYMLHRTRLKK